MSKNFRAPPIDNSFRSPWNQLVLSVKESTGRMDVDCPVVDDCPVQTPPGHFVKQCFFVQWCKKDKGANAVSPHKEKFVSRSDPHIPAKWFSLSPAHDVPGPTHKPWRSYHSGLGIICIIYKEAYIFVYCTVAWEAGKTPAVEALMLPKITVLSSSHPLSFDLKWKHLMDISLPDPNFSTPGNINLLLGANIFNHGQQFGPLGTASAFKTCFRWVLASVICCWPRCEIKTERVIYPPPQ